jgi:hypothetical protein
MRKLLQNDLIVNVPLGLIYYLRSIIDRGCVYGGLPWFSMGSE